MCVCTEECLPAILEADNITALGVNCIQPALVAPALQVRLQTAVCAFEEPITARRLVVCDV